MIPQILENAGKDAHKQTQADQNQPPNIQEIGKCQGCRMGNDPVKKSCQQPF